MYDACYSFIMYPEGNAYELITKHESIQVIENGADKTTSETCFLFKLGYKGMSLYEHTDHIDIGHMCSH